ncbi:uncharacterized protein LOC133205572 [Saccostrea echinata]|uniref:uncharacterized protein LOC133205572 n=1 Tax=Saccostrea echinata TaxID=191078 RepID=UPI002A80D3C5|nr:uncharacterized protein LOC133205572 [Saccostrea echinata]
MVYNLLVDGSQTTVTLSGDKITFESSGIVDLSYQLDDIIGCDEVVMGWFYKTEVTRLWVIEHGHSNLLLKKCKIVSGDQRKRFQHDLTEKITNKTKRPKRVLVMINPKGGNGTAKKDFRDIVEPVLRLSGISMDIIFTERSGHMTDVAKTYEFCNTDGIVILGGDGSYHEVVNELMRRRQEEQGMDINDQNATLSALNIPIAMIPTGTACGVTECNTGNTNVLTAVLHVIKGRTVSSHLLALYNNRKLLGFGGTDCGYGVMTDLLYYSDTKFRWLGRSRYFFVPIWMFLFKSQTNRNFDATVTYYTSVNEQNNKETSETEIFVEDKRLSGYSSYTSDTVTFNRMLWNIMTVNGNFIFDGKVVFDVPRAFVPKPTMCSSFLFYGDVSAGVMNKFFKHIGNRTPMEFSDKELEVLNVLGLTVELRDSLHSKDPEMATLKRLIHLDGEMYQLESPSFQLWYKLDVVQIFSSYL